MKQILRQPQDVATLRISLIITAKNETRSLSNLLNSIAKQTRRPDDVVLTYVRTAHGAQPTIHSEKLNVRFIALESGDNRAKGRNIAIAAAKNEHVLITDAGCRLKETWVQEMSAGFEKADVVAGFYAGEFKNIFEKCQLPYVLVTPDKLDTHNFLPATRSMGITKTAWKKAGKFNERYRYAEDYEFARRIQQMKMPIFVVPTAIVYWRPRESLKSFSRMIFEHAYGDGYANSFRPKVLTIYVRYAILALLGFWSASWRMEFGILSFSVYLAYAIQKNYRYVNDPHAFIYLPLLQISSDFAVMIGTVYGIFQRFSKRPGMDRVVSDRS